MTSAWGAGGSGGGWAEQVEEEEAKNGGILGGDDFPTLGAAAKTEPQKKKKPTKMPLSAFVAAGSRNMSDLEIRHSLPTVPRGRDGTEGDSGLGGAFKDYGGERRGGFHRDDDDDRRGGREEDMGPSRADMADDWGKERKFVSGGGGGGYGGGGGGGYGGGGGFGGGGFRDREGGFNDREGGFGDRGPREDMGPSRADESSSWGRDNKFSAAPRDDGYGAPRRGGFGGFEDRGPRGGFGDERRGGPGGGFGGERRGYDEPSRADEGDWGARRPLSPRGPPGGDRGSKNYGFAGDRGEEEGSRWGRRPGEGPPGGDSSSGPAERPRLKLAPRTKPIENPLPPPAPAPAAAAPAEGGDTAAPAPAPKPRSNPFGAARPREEVLREKGVDPVKEELKLEHHADLREDTPEEVALKKEIEELRLQVEVLKAADGESSEEASKMAADLDAKEVHLFKLAADLDAKVKYARKPARESAGEGGAAAGENGAAAAEGAANGEGEFIEAGKGGVKAAPAAKQAPSRW